ncbi:BON domain-containing protein [Streptomyces sp. NPDC056486]|uniref:BON domain-containing protein n=1 Tax=Streptomyces sp. NPDC056486 TaxID=3345835 RepID=UPI003695F23D
MARYEFTREAGHQLEVPLVSEPDKAAAQLKGRLEDLGLTHDHFRVSVEGFRVVVAGDAALQEQKEKILLALGNVAGVAEVEDRVAAGQEGLLPRFVTVQEGETLSDVALRAYNDPTAGKRLLTANRPTLTDENAIYPGLVLRAPE